MSDEKKRCGGLEEHQWLITLIIEAVIKMIVAYLDREKFSERSEEPTAETTTHKRKET